MLPKISLCAAIRAKTPKTRQNQNLAINGGADESAMDGLITRNRSLLSVKIEHYITEHLTEQMAYIERIQPRGVPLNVLTTIAEYYIANKPYDSDWCVLPVTNIEAYLGSSSLGRQYLSKIPSELMEGKQSSFGASVYRMVL